MAFARTTSFAPISQSQLHAVRCSSRGMSWFTASAMFASLARRVPRPVIHRLSTTWTSIYSSQHILRPTFASCNALSARRCFSAAPLAIPSSAMTTDQYDALSDRTMDGMLDGLESLIDTRGENGWEVEYHSGVLTLNLGTHGIYVVNKQPPNKQIWLSSPTSGPKRYDWNPELQDWIYVRDGVSLRTLLDNELSAIFNQPVSDIIGEGAFFETK